jgi:hypothetical protein
MAFGPSKGPLVIGFGYKPTSELLGSLEVGLGSVGTTQRDGERRSMPSFSMLS